jgi:hypothetical protein
MKQGFRLILVSSHDLRRGLHRCASSAEQSDSVCIIQPLEKGETQWTIEALRPAVERSYCPFEADLAAASARDAGGLAGLVRGNLLESPGGLRNAQRPCARGRPSAVQYPLRPRTIIAHK